MKKSLIFALSLLVVGCDSEDNTVSVPVEIVDQIVEEIEPASEIADESLMIVLDALLEKIEEIEVDESVEETELPVVEEDPKITLLAELDKSLESWFEIGQRKVDEVYYSTFIEYSDQDLEYSEYHIRALSVNLKEPIADYFRTVDHMIPLLNEMVSFDNEDLEILLTKYKYIWFKSIDDLFIDKFYQYQDTAEYTPKAIQGLKYNIEGKFNDLIQDLI